MKKIIATAVAAAFVAPVMAADITLSGDFEYFYKNVDITDEPSNASFQGGDQVIVVSATSETAMGWKVSADMNILTNNDGNIANTDGGESITVAGPFGTVSVGDVSGALDNVGDYTDVAPRDGGFGADGSDASILYVLPTLVPGLKVSVSHTPADDEYDYNMADLSDYNYGSGNDNNFDNSPGGESFSVAYNFGPGEVYYGFQDLKIDHDETAEMTAFGIKYSVGGLMLAAESGRFEADGEDGVDMRGFAATYTVGDTTLILESQDYDAREQMIFAAKHNLGGGLGVYAQLTAAEDDVAGEEGDATYVGVTYAF